MTQDGGTGRWPEMERLVDGLGQAAGGTGCCYGITGPTGIGKTHLLRKLEKTADSLGFQVLRGHGGPGAGPEQVFSALLPPKACVPRERLPRMAMDQLGAISSRGPALLTLDDFHMADPASVPVLIFLSRNIARVPVMIAIAYDCDVLENAPGGAHPLTYGLRILVREGTFEELRLENLDRLALEKVLEEEFMDPLESSLADLIWARSEGNPMVAIEEVRLLIQSRQVERCQGRWGAAGSINPELPDGYSAFIRTRLDLLAPEDRDALAIAAVIGRTFDPKIVAALQGRDLLEVLEALDRVAHDHKLLEEDGERYRFSMGAVRSVLLDELPRSRIKEVHGRIGTVLERGVGRDMPLDDLSEHYYQAERAEKCVCFSLLAGQRALAERRWQGAREHFQKVLDATEGGGFPEERISSLEGIADADAALGRVEEARCWYRLLLDERPPTVVRERVLRKMQ